MTSVMEQKSLLRKHVRVPTTIISQQLAIDWGAVPRRTPRVDDLSSNKLSI